MAQPSLETQTKVASEAAENFVDQYYDALNKRHSLDRFYASASAKLTAASVVPDISVNGKPLAGGVAELDALLKAQQGGGGGSGGGGGVHYDVASFDAQPVNPEYRLGLPEHMISGGGGGGGGGHNSRSSDRDLRNGDRMSFAVQVSGTVRYGGKGGGAAAVTDGAAAGGDGSAAAPAGPLEQAFNESWLLVPHWEAHGRHAPRGLRKWLVVSQNYRTL